jgi:hypothetical protein
MNDSHRNFLGALLLTAGVSACAAAPQAGAPAATPATAAAAPTGKAIALRNPGFEVPPRLQERCALHWSCTMHADPESFRYTLETARPGAGERSICIESVKKEPWALLTQAVEDPALRGRKLRFSVAVRTEGTTGRGAGPWVLVQGVHPTQGHFERVVPKTDGWERVAVEFIVAPAMTLFEVGGVLEGGGRACFDDARLELVD